MTAPRRTLVVIDAQHVFADPGSPWGAPGFADIVGPLQRLVAHFRPDVVFTRFVAPSEPAGAWVEYYRQFPFALRPADDPIYALVEPFAGRPTLDAETFGKWGPQLDGLTGDELVIGGVSTDCCVVATVLAAADAGRRVLVAADACAGSQAAEHERALELMALFAPLVEITDVDALVRG